MVKPVISEARGSDGKVPKNAAHTRKKQKLSPETAGKRFPSPFRSFCAKSHGLNRSKTKFSIVFTESAGSVPTAGPANPLKSFPWSGRSFCTKFRPLNRPKTLFQSHVQIGHVVRHDTRTLGVSGKFPESFHKFPEVSGSFQKFPVPEVHKVSEVPNWLEGFMEVANIFWKSHGVPRCHPAARGPHGVRPP